jgi:hypothetical protein
MIRVAAGLVLALASTCAPSAAAADNATQSHSVSLPESVLQDASAGMLYCSSVGGREAKPETITAKDGDGFISILLPDGTVNEQKAMPLAGDLALNAPKGMTMVGGALWVADIDRVVGFDLKTRKELAAIDLAGAEVAFANDLLAIDDQRLLVSDTARGKVLVVTPGATGSLVSELEPPLVVEGANGLARGADGTLVITQFSFAGKPMGVSRVAVDWKTLTHEAPGPLPFPEGMWDGVAVAKDGTIYASDWKSGAIWALAPKAEAAKQLEADVGFKGPADFCLLADGKTILCPDMVKQQVKVVDLTKR